MRRTLRCASLLLSAAFICTLQVYALPEAEAHTSRFSPVNDSVYTRQALFDRFFSERKLLVVFGASTPQMEQRIRNEIERSAWRWRTDLQVQRAEDTRPEDLKKSAILLVGTPATNPYLTQFPPSVPLAFKKSGFTFLGKEYTGKDVLNLVYPSTHNPVYPMFVVAGWDEAAILAVLDDRQVRVYDYQIIRDDHHLRLGHFSQAPGSLWQPDPDLDMDFEESEKLVGATENFRFYMQGAAVDHNRLAEIIRRREENYRRIEDFAQGMQARTPRSTFQYFVYPSLQDKAMITNSMEFAHVNYDQQAVHVALEAGIDSDALHKDAVLIVRSRFGETALAVLEDGLSVYLSGSWLGKPYREWADRIAHANLQMPIEALLDNDRYFASSPLMREVLAGAMVACMIERWGRDTFLGHYNWWKPAPDEWYDLNYMWEQCMQDGRKRFKPLPKRSLPVGGAFQKGFNFAHEGFGIANGYGSRSAEASLDKLKDMGSSAVSIIPYTFMRDPQQAMPFRLPNTVGDENDAAVAHTARYAQSIGFTTMIKPQIWIRGSWPGDIDMGSPEAWDEFFAHYEHWIAHYALLGEIFDVDILCIGTELTRATLYDQDRWATFANELRSIFSGQLVYAPNWGEEFENLTFWDAFDYIGLNNYYPLSDLDNPTDKDLLAGARAVVRRMEKAHRRFDKPVLLTEIGFANTSAPWKLPYLEDRGAPPNPEHQARCYKAMVEALSDIDFLQGIYWWKWPSYLDRGGMDQRGFTPNNKLAEQVVAGWYKSIELSAK